MNQAELQVHKNALNEIFYFG